MGVTSSRIEDDKALLLCQGRRDFVRQVLDGRRALAAAHLSYVQSLKNTGVAIRKFVEPEAPVESSLCTSTSATPEPLALTKKSASQFSNSSPSLSQHVEGVESDSLLSSSPYSGRFQGNYIKSNGNVSKTVEQRPPLSVTALIKGKTEAEKEHGSGRRAEADKEHGPENKLAAKDLFSSVKEIEFLFLEASESGRDVPRMLEANKVNFRPLFSEGKASRSKGSTFLTAIFVCCKEEVRVAQESTTNEIKYITWHRSVSSHSSSSRNHVGATSKDDIEDTSSSLFSCLCMDSGSHASTLDRLYAWERKLYDEVRASSIICREYDMKCKLLRHQDSKGEKLYRVDKTRAAVRELHSRIRVAIQRINYISKIIEDLRDKELQPQLDELIGGLSRMWGMMLECHKLQCDIISVAYNNGNSKVSMWSEYHREAAILLEYELKGLNSSFNEWMTAHKSYLQAINGWLLKCVFPVKQSHKPRKRSIEFSPHRDIAPPIYVICKDWVLGLEKLPAKDMENAMKKLAAEVNNSLPRQEKKNRKTGRRGELPEDVKRNEDLVDCSLCLETLQKDLKSFLNQLKTFAEASAKMYGDLGIAIDKARRKYENLGWMQIPLMA